MSGAALGDGSLGGGALGGPASGVTGARVIRISDLSDARLADYNQQTDVALKKARGTEHGLYLAESLLVFQRALRAGHVPRSVLSLEGTADDAVAALSAHASRVGVSQASDDHNEVSAGTATAGEVPTGSAVWEGIPAIEVPVFVGEPELLESLTGYVLHRGLIASMQRPALSSPEALLASARRIVVLENIADPTNVGAIFRSVAAIGADAVLVTPRCSDPFYRRAIRVSMGTVLQVPWTRVGDWDSTRALLAASGFHIAALALADGAVDLRAFASRVSPSSKVALVLGAEGEGLTAEAIAAADTVVRIPMAHGIDSLNVAATAAVAMYALAGLG